MVQTVIRVLLLVPFLGACGGVPAGALQDPLPVREGLELWLDASRLAAGRPVEVWPDASGRGRDLAQPAREKRPLSVRVDGRPVVRFDGRAQHLARTGGEGAFADLTVFVVAAPFSNAGGFRGMLALNAPGQNDFTSGLNLDHGPNASVRFDFLNAEGAGFPGARNLLKGSLEFGVLKRWCLAAGPSATRLYVDGQFHGQRGRAASRVSLQEVTLGARRYELGGAPQVRGFWEGDIAEVLVYGRLLSDEERTAVDRYLALKHGTDRKIPIPPRPGAGKPLLRVENPPPVQVFVPGFAVRELPVSLPNVNNVLYRHDGKLVALAYDGAIYLLSDADGDGLEEKAELFWDGQGRLRGPIGMALAPAGYARGEGVFVASKGKFSLIADADRDGKAEQEIVIASGWKELPHGVDALGVARDPKTGDLYFGLGCLSFTQPYAGYRRASERGTILRVAPDFSAREIFCTGIRFSVALRFNAAGDLFATDQEGATWLPNGNPFDELLHVEKGRHYGFPPRHPVHLPGVIDEPSLWDYRPQHQSTCGMNFNEPVVAGPEGWRSDAFVAGYSRGKLYRTRLAKSAGGYVAQNHLLASLTMLAADVCVSPRGDLVVAAHSGGPDWGSGPTGKGKLYQIRYAGRDLPQPVAVWPQGPREVRVAFDRPLEPAHLERVSEKPTLEYGAYVAPGDRFETLRPGYQVVVDQLLAPRFEIPVLSVQVAQDRRTLILATGRHREQASYALTLSGLGRRAGGQVPETDLGYDLSGAEAEWQGREGTWKGWLPHLDLSVARRFTAASAAHDELWARLAEPGTLRLRTKFDLWHVLRPAVQPGSKIDYEWPEERVTLVFRGSEHEVKANAALKAEGGATELTFVPRKGAPLPVEVVVKTPGDLSVTWRTNEDQRPRALPLGRLLLPWAELEKPAAEVAREIPELKGGSWLRGREIFFSDQAACAKCHAVGGRGGKVGPDLSNLPHRDYHSVVRDIAEPSFAINPDYVTSVVALSDGRVLTGVVRTEGDAVHIADTDGKVTTVRRGEIEKMKPSALSVMPEGLLKALGPEKLRDLMTFLLLEPPRMPEYGKGTPPPARSLKEVHAVLSGAPGKPAKGRPIHVVLVAGRKDHGPGEHDYPAWQSAWSRLLGMAEGVRVTTATAWPSPEDLSAADAMVFYQQGTWTAERARDIDAFLARGGGLVYLHYAVDGGADAPGFAGRIGLAWQGGRSKFRHGPLELVFERSGHPIARNLDRVKFHDESYWNLAGEAGKIGLLATAVEEGRPQPLLWTLEPGKGRVFVSILGHYSWTFDDPVFRILLLRAIAWAAREPVDRLNDLVLPGARVSE